MGLDDTTPIYRPFRASCIFIEGKGFYCLDGYFSFNPLRAVLFYDTFLDKITMRSVVLMLHSFNDQDQIRIVEAPDMFLVYLPDMQRFIQDLYNFDTTPNPAHAERFLGDSISEVRYNLDHVCKDYRILHIC